MKYIPIVSYNATTSISNQCNGWHNFYNIHATCTYTNIEISHGIQSSYPGRGMGGWGTHHPILSNLLLNLDKSVDASKSKLHLTWIFFKASSFILHFFTFHRSLHGLWTSGYIISQQQKSWPQDVTSMT
jgi:hypothetical protein